MRRRASRLACVLAVSTLCACASNPASHPDDPFEGMNRSFWAFNEGLDKHLARPIAEGYVETVPETARLGLHNFVYNAAYSTTIINDLLQGKVRTFLEDTGRLVFNTIVGIGGFVDAASMIGMEKHKEDFGQTLGVWGFGEGIYLMMPLYGPTTARDFVGVLVDTVTSPTFRLPLRAGAPLDTMSYIDTRAGLLSANAILDQQPDTYLFVRSAYLQDRVNMVYDGYGPIDTSEFDAMEQDSGSDQTAPAPENASAAASEAPAEAASGVVPETPEPESASAPVPTP